MNENFIRDNIFKLVGVTPECRFAYYRKDDGLSVDYEDKSAKIGYATKAQAARAHFLLAKALEEGKTEFHIKQKPAFDMLGVMIHAAVVVPTVDGIKDYITNMAALGMNMLMLYTEDTYVVEKYPYFGHLKNGYTIEELREIDEYAYNMGVEMIPCIQTLAHMAKYLIWEAAGEIKQSAATLLVDEEKTYTFIEETIKTMRSAFRTKRIHVGMDEAKDLGMGEFYARHGFENRFDIFNRHLGRVVDICKKYDFQPMIWSDLYFSLEGKIRYDYDENVVVPQRVIDAIPNTDLVFWDYYHDYQNFYDVNIDKHMSFGKKMIFAGGSWDWDGFAPNLAYTLKTMRPALTACLQKGVKEVFSTTWGGAHTPYFETLTMLPVFSEMCYLGEKCTNDDIYKMIFDLRGVSREMHEAMSGMYLGYDGWVSATKRFVYSDVLIDLINYNFDYEKSIPVFEKSLRTLLDIEKNKTYDADETEYYRLLAQICLEKCKIRAFLRKKYKECDKAYLENLAKNTLPELCETYRKFLNQIRRRWKMYCKIQGLDAMVFDFNGIMGRIRYAAEVIEDFVEGRTSKIDELEIEILPDRNVLYKSPLSHTRVNE